MRIVLSLDSWPALRDFATDDRSELGAAAVLALTPSIGFSIASEVLVPDEIRAFQQAAKQLGELDRGALA